ncbi:MBL fold metallo-hydrolase [candidate division WOR-3 bacterium]|nr:MBL fold metallo-hydrolase [candidate division WOR-3 bacterium]
MKTSGFPFGSLTFHLICEGTFWLDGGAMFGVVPKVLWHKLNPADDMNRIKLALNCLVVEHPDGVVLVDTGIGEGLKERFLEMYKVEKKRTLKECLAEHGIAPEDVSFVINTHLHFDHCGGNTVRVDRKWRPTFPNARYIVQKLEWEDAVDPNERTQASYLKETFSPIEQAGQLDLVSEEHEVLPGIKVVRTNGHTRGHQSVLIECEGRKALYLGDLIPTTSHIKIPYTMGYDLYPMDLVETKKRLLKQAVAENWLLIFEHDPLRPFGYVGEEDGRFVIKPFPQSNVSGEKNEDQG